MKERIVREGMTVGAWCLCSVMAFSVDCPKQPQQVSTDWQAEVNGSIAKIGRLSGAELKGETKTVTQDLFVKLPNADRIYLEQMMYASYCSALRDDKTISESEKAKRLKDYSGEVRRTIAQQTAKPAKAVPPPLLPVLNLNFSATPTNSTDKAAPYAMKVVIQTNAVIQPTSLVIQCSSEIAKGELSMAGGLLFQGMGEGYPGSDHRVYWIFFRGPAFTPEGPIIVTLMSKEPFSVKAIGRGPRPPFW